MEDKLIQVEPREIFGTTGVRRLRKQGFAPAVVYANGESAKSISVNSHQFLMAARGCKPTQLFTLSSQDKALNGTKVFVKDVQLEPIKDLLVHVDFLSISAGHKVTIDVPVEIVGEAIGVKSGDSVLEQRTYFLSLECLPEKIPGAIVIDISKLAVGDSINAHEVALPEGVTLKSNHEMTIVSLSEAAAVAVAAPAATTVAAPAAATAKADPKAAKPSK